MSDLSAAWNNTSAYEQYIGRWSRIISVDFVSWLNPTPEQTWLEIGCGTGALTSAMLELASPARITAIDTSAAYVEQAKVNLPSGKISFLHTDLAALSGQERFDCVTSGLVLNFLADPEASLAQMIERCRSGGEVSAFVWDYAGHYQPMRHFWDAARSVSPLAAAHDAGVKFTLCSRDRLVALFHSGWLSNVQFTTLERVATFNDFDDYWQPIASAQGSVTAFMSAITKDQQDQLRETLKRRLPIAANGEIKLVINCLAVKGRNCA